VLVEHDYELGPSDQQNDEQRQEATREPLLLMKPEGLGDAPETKPQSLIEAGFARLRYFGQRCRSGGFSASLAGSLNAHGAELVFYEHLLTQTGRGERAQRAIFPNQ